MTANEIKQMEDYDIIVFHHNLPPFRARRMNWLEHIKSTSAIVLCFLLRRGTCSGGSVTLEVDLFFFCHQGEVVCELPPLSCLSADRSKLYWLEVGAVFLEAQFRIDQVEGLQFFFDISNNRTSG